MAVISKKVPCKFHPIWCYFLSFLCEMVLYQQNKLEHLHIYTARCKVGTKRPFQIWGHISATSGCGRQTCHTPPHARESLLRIKSHRMSIGQYLAPDLHL